MIPEQIKTAHAALVASKAEMDSAMSDYTAAITSFDGSEDSRRKVYRARARHIDARATFRVCRDELCLLSVEFVREELEKEGRA